MLDEDESVFAAMRAGARGYVVKGADTEDVLRAAPSPSPGGTPSSARRLPVGCSSYLTRPLSARDPGPVPGALRPRARGARADGPWAVQRRDRAGPWWSAPKTVRNHVSNVFSKLQVTHRAEAVVRARRAGLGDGP